MSVLRLPFLGRHQGMQHPGRTADGRGGRRGAGQFMKLRREIPDCDWHVVSIGFEGSVSISIDFEIVLYLVGIGYWIGLNVSILPSRMAIPRPSLSNRPPVSMGSPA